QCNDTPAGAIVDTNGCEVFSLAADTFSVVVTSASCAGMNNGSVALSAKDERYSYAFNAGDGGSGVLNAANGYSATLEGLSPGTYNICFTVDGQASYQRCYSITVGEPAPLETSAVVNNSTRTVDLSLRGAKQYKVTLNGKPMVTDKALLTLPLVAGKNTIEVRTDLECQGVYFEEVFVSEEVKVYPNPTSGPLQIYVGGSDRNVSLSVSSMQGTIVYNTDLSVGTSRFSTIDLSQLSSGVYIVTLKSATVTTSHKIIKD
ncbi:MAG: T9SS type A sorting domain-containing protein, partial [Flavobacteriaceae bacterium]